LPDHAAPADAWGAMPPPQLVAMKAVKALKPCCQKSLTRSAVAGLAGKAKAGRGGNTSQGPAERGGRAAPGLCPRWSKGRGALRPEHLRFRPRPVGSKTLHLVLLDLSASMLRGEKLAWAKGLAGSDRAVLPRSRPYGGDRICGRAGTVAAVPGESRGFRAGWIAPLRGGGGTPIQPAVDAVEGALRRCPPGTLATVWLLTDGRFDPLPVRPEGGPLLHHRL
jgi:magnesium chelatase subunit ChlD-like protein